MIVTIHLRTDGAIRVFSRRNTAFALRLGREELASCFLLVCQLSYHKCSYWGNSIVPTAKSNGIKKFHGQALFERNSDYDELYPDNHTSNNPSTKNQSQRFAHAQTDPILRSHGFQHWFKNWQELRKEKLTASTFGGAIGFWPRRRVQLWLEKLGAIEPFSGNLATCWSNIKEEEALEKYKLITSNTVSFPPFQVRGKKNSENNWLGASPDGTAGGLVYGLSSSGVLEIKCPFFNGDKSISFPYNRVPLYYIPQVQGLMEIMDKDWMDLYVWTCNGSSLFRIERDKEYWFAVETALSDFWWMHVQPAKKECRKRVVTDPVKELKKHMPAPRHELHSFIVYESRRIIDKSRLVMREINGRVLTNEINGRVLTSEINGRVLTSG